MVEHMPGFSRLMLFRAERAGDSSIHANWIARNPRFPEPCTP